MKINFHGVRGSYPKTGEHFSKIGGNTSCVSITKEKFGKIHRIIIDSGTGIIDLGNEIISNFFKNSESLNMSIFFTHLHPDHTQGFPFFAPNYFKNSTIHLFGMETLKKNIGKILSDEMVPPTFPIEYHDLKSNRKNYVVEDNDIVFINITVKDYTVSSNQTANSLFKIHCLKSYAPSHPQQGSMYYKIIDLEDNRSIGCIWDIESIYGGDQRVISFFKGTDVIIHDTQYTEEEYNSDKIVVQGFGHSTYKMAIENAVKIGCSKLIGFHYNPKHTDDFLFNIKEKVKNESIENKYSLDFDLAIEGNSLDISK
ncbi:MAG TPA: MBL fold metallo-hydrolase [Spirochaetota bacterium]|nr:MBL fold metallo-hydrolase [Spirochaetota bacterium]